MSRCLIALAVCLLPFAAMAVDVDGDVYFDEKTPTPASVLAL